MAKEGITSGMARKGMTSGMTQEGMTPPYDLGSHFLEKCMGFLGQCQVFRLE